MCGRRDQHQGIDVGDPCLQPIDRRVVTDDGDFGSADGERANCLFAERVFEINLDVGVVGRILRK